jgi:hypothetical protein
MDTANSRGTPVCEVRSYMERDADLWLCEELRVNAEFARWFAAQANIGQELQVPAYRVRPSVMAENGETDVEAVFTTSQGLRVALLIENKIEHSLSADQLKRYRDRGQYGLTYGSWDAFHVVVFAPSSKLAKYAHLLQETPHISFEEAASFLRSLATDLRSAYRAEFIARAASEQKLDADGSDAFRIAFWKRVYAMLDEQYPDFFDLDPAAYPKTTYIAANCRGAPGYFRLDLKGHMGEVDIAFRNTNPGNLVAYLEAKKPTGAGLVFNKRSIALQVKGLPKFFVGEGIDAASKALESFQAAHMLLSFWQENRSFFDQHYGITLNVEEAGSQPRSEIGRARSRSDRDAPYSLTLPERAYKTDKYLVVPNYGIPPKDRWLDLAKLISFVQNEQTKLWTITAPKHQLEARGVIENAEPVQT